MDKRLKTKRNKLMEWEEEEEEEEEEEKMNLRRIFVF